MQNANIEAIKLLLGSSNDCGSGNGNGNGNDVLSLVSYCQLSTTQPISGSVAGSGGGGGN
jgi:hypothetical protein